MSIVLVVMTDGRRDCISRTIPSALANLEGSITRRILHDDSGDASYRSWLQEQFPTFEVVGGLQRRGFSGAYANIWQHLRFATEPYVFSVEDDFLFNYLVSLSSMIDILDANPNLVQLSLLRQPWNEEEQSAGGIIQCHPDDFEQQDGWIKHRRYFTTNPNLHRRSLCYNRWPTEQFSEGVLGARLLANPNTFFGIWGSGEEWVRHIGNERVGTGY